MRLKRRTLPEGPGVGQRLQEARLAQGLSLGRIAKATKIQEPHLSAFEADQFGSLPEVYERGLIRAYALFLSIEPEPLLSTYDRSRKITRHTSKVEVPPTRRWQLPFTLTKRRAWGLVTLLLLIGVSLGTRGVIAELNQPPKLELSLRQAGDLAELHGETTPGASLWVADSAVTPDAEGRFSVKLLIPDETTSLKVKARSSYGRESVVHRELSPGKTSLDEGRGPVRLTVRVGLQSTFLDIEAEAPLFRGIALPGAIHTFSGPSITISTSNAGTTALTLSNDRLSVRDLGPLGGKGEKVERLTFLPGTEVE